MAAATKGRSRARVRAEGKERRGKILVGTASWTDPGFVADWYPPDLPPRKRLEWYAEHFRLVEVNSSFYAIPSAKSVASWCEQTPDDFVFDVKLHRLLSRHSTPPKLLPPELRGLARTRDSRVELTPTLETAMTERMLEAIEPLVEADRLGALMLQLSPSFSPRHNELEELDHLLELLADYKVAVELRNRSWVEGEQLEQTAAYFRKRRVAFVDVDGPKAEHFMIMPDLDLVTTPRLAYFRAHGRNARGYITGRTVAARFDYKYSDAELEEIADRVDALSRQTREVHVIYNNNKSNYAPLAAGRFQEIVAGRQASAKGRG